MPRLPDDSPESCPGEPQAPRGPYRADGLDDLPPLPTMCPRCGKELVFCELEIWCEYVPAVRCWCCGFTTDRQMLANRLAPPEIEHRGKQPVKPRPSGTQHGAAVSAGMKAAKGHRV